MVDPEVIAGRAGVANGKRRSPTDAPYRSLLRTGATARHNQGLRGTDLARPGL